MGLLTGLLLLPVTGPVKGLTFVLERIRDEAESQLGTEDRLQTELLHLAIRYEQGEISDTEYLEQETILLDQLNRLRTDRDVPAEGRPAGEAPEEGELT